MRLKLYSLEWIMKKVRWGVLSTAKIAREKVIPAMLKAEHVELVAIASRNYKKAKEVADSLGIASAYGSYEDLLNDDSIEAIYNPMPNHLHVPWAIKALEAGKHILCEKPIALSVTEAEELAAAAKKYPQLKAMEAFMYRFHPQWIEAKELLDSGEIGELKTIQSFFSYFLDDPSNVRSVAEWGGGGLMDIGCYNISLSRFIFGSEPKRVVATLDYDEQTRVDNYCSGILEFENGKSNFSCSTYLSPYQRVNIFATKGRIEIEIPFNAPADRPSRIWLEKDALIREIVFDIVDQYTLQAEAFSLAILNNTNPPTPLSDAVNNMKVIEAVFESAKNNSWLEL